MFVKDNSVLSFKKYFFDKLNSTYEIEEVEQLYALCFFYFKGWSKVELRMNERMLLSESELLELNKILKRLAFSEPIQHLFSSASFFDLEFYVDQNVLIPRQETEELVDLILRNTNGRTLSLLDIGTGSGCIPIALAINNRKIKVSGLDVSNGAITIAKKNAETHEVDLTLYCEDVLTLSSLDSLESLKIDVIVSNPPYITMKEKEQMHKNVLDFDPHIALFVDDNAPLLFYKKITNLAFDKLEIGGELYFEINECFGVETKQMIEDVGFNKVYLIKDLNDKDRMIHAIK